MNIFEILGILDLAANNALKYKGIAFDGYCFYITEVTYSKIYKYDKCFKLIECIDTCKPYTAICYDIKQNCFWVSVKECPNKVFKLDKDFNEIGYIAISSYEPKWGCIESISCDCCSNQLMIAYSRCIVEIEKGACPKVCVLQESCSKYYLAVLYLYTCYVVVYTKQCHQFLAIYSFEHQLIERICLPPESTIEDMTFCGYWDEAKTAYVINVLVSNQSNKYVLKCKISGKALHKCCSPCDYCKDVDDCYTTLLDKCERICKDKCEDKCERICKDKCEDKCERICKDKCEDKCERICKDKCEDKCERICKDKCEDKCERICEDKCEDKCERICKDKCEDKCEQLCKDRCKGICDPMLRKLCEEKCEQKCKELCEEKCEQKCKELCEEKCEQKCKELCEEKCENKCKELCEEKCEHKCKELCGDECTDHCKQLRDIIESIALVEAAAAHVLNSEGEKIQKVVRCSNNIKDILETNKIVNKTIVNIIHLEQVLYSKLDLVLDCDCKDVDPCYYDKYIDNCLKTLKNG